MPKSKLPKISVLIEHYEIEYSQAQVRDLVKAAGQDKPEELIHCVAAFALLGAQVYADRCARAQELARKAKKAKGKKSK